MLKSLRLTILGLDVLINVMAFLRPSDIINMRQTCKTLKAAAMHRIVWLNAVAQMMEEHHIPQATYQTASMDQAALEHLALSPAKFASLIENSPDEKIYPRSVRILQDHITNEDKAKFRIERASDYEDALLAPGGRFLITSRNVRRTSSTRNLVRVWDLGLCGQDKVKLLVQTFLTRKPIRLRSLSLMPDGAGFYLVSEQTSKPRKLFVHKITAFDLLPRIDYLNEIDIPGLADSLAVSGTRLVVISARTVIIVWDFEADLSVSWESGLDGDDVEYSSPIHLYSENVMLYRSGKLCFWKIPQLHAEKEAVHVENRRLITLSDLFEDPDDGNVSDSEDEITFNLLQSPWSHSFNDPGFLGISKGAKFRLFHIQRLQAINDVKLPCILPSLVGSSDNVDLSYLEPGASVGALKPCDRQLMFVVQNEPDVWVHRPDMLMDGSKLSSVKKRLMVDYLESLDHVQLCFATGRLCVAVDDRQICIIDFLQPP